MPSDNQARSRTTSSNPRESVDLVTKLKMELRSFQLIWWLAHLFIIFSSFQYALGITTFPGEIYRRVLKGALVAYGIVLYRTHKVKIIVQ
jgi:hypothetical protein